MKYAPWYMKYPLWCMRSIALLAVVTGCGIGQRILADPPARVGRVNYLSGDVSFRPADFDEWTEAAVNRPLTTGDHLWTDYNSRAELHVGSTAVRLSSQTDFTFLNLDDQTTQIRLSQGSINVHIYNLGERAAFEVDTPNASVSLLRPGRYRIDVAPDGYNTKVTVRAGETEVNADNSAFPVYSNQTASVSGEDSPTYDVQAAYANDGWDNWCDGRDRREVEAASLRYVSRETIGYEDLDEYGSWRTDPRYGAIWIPAQQEAGWAPYRYGHWAWIQPWGWTWVDDQPWGFAPFHYGRWAVVGGGTWAWIPGQVVARPVYAPALVAFVNIGNFSLSLGFGHNAGVAWFPLGPQERYIPAYRASNNYVRNVNVNNISNTKVTNTYVTNNNVTNNYNVTNVRYVNQTVPGAVTAVPQNVFAGARPVAKEAVVVPTKIVASTPVTAMTAPVAPSRESFAAVRPANNNAGAVKQPPATTVRRQVVTRITPPSSVTQTPGGARAKMASSSLTRPVNVVPMVKSNKIVAAPPLKNAPPVKNTTPGNANPARVKNSDATQTMPPRPPRPESAVAPRAVSASKPGAPPPAKDKKPSPPASDAKEKTDKKSESKPAKKTPDDRKKTTDDKTPPQKSR